MNELARDPDHDEGDHDGGIKGARTKNWRCGRCQKIKASSVEIPVGWYHIIVTTNFPGEGVKGCGWFACSRACYDALKLARIDSSKA